MPPPDIKNANRRPILDAGGGWASHSDHKLCDTFFELHQWDRSLKAEIKKRGELRMGEHDDILAAQLAMTALHEEISTRMKKIIRRSQGLDKDQVEDVVQELMRKLVDPNEATSNSLRGRFPGATGSFAQTVKDRKKDILKTERREMRRRSASADQIPPLAPEEEPVDLDELRSYITTPEALAVFDGVRAGLTRGEIAVQLDVSERTIARYKRDALEEIRRKRAEEDR